MERGGFFVLFFDCLFVVGFVIVVSCQKLI